MCSEHLIDWEYYFVALECNVPNLEQSRIEANALGRHCDVMRFLMPGSFLRSISYKFLSKIT